jgi:hypothetical protein
MYNFKYITPRIFRACPTNSVKFNTVLHQPNALIYLNNTKIFFKILDKNPYIYFGLSISHLQGVSQLLVF